MENWKVINDFPNYEISNFGNIRNKTKLLKIVPNKQGYNIVVLCNGGIRKTINVHRLVAAAFVPNPENKPCVDHIDGDRANNHADNLRWVTAKENCNNPITKSRLHKKIGVYMTGRLGGLHQRAKEIAMYSACGDLIKTFLSVKDAQRETGLNDSNIIKCCKGIKKTCGGYILGLCIDLKKYRTRYYTYVGGSNHTTQKRR